MRTTARIEARKLAAQLPLRVLAIVCLVGPFAFAGLLHAQSTAPSDALLGAYAQSSGYALCLVVLSFAANWGFPIVAGVLAGDVFASEDRLGTWKTLLTRSRSLREVYLGKLLAATGAALALGVVLAVASVLAGVLVIGGQPTIDLSGRLLSSSHLLGLTVLAWVVSLIPTLAYVAVALLVSAWARNGIVGVLAPVILTLLTQLLALLGTGAWAHLILPGAGFDAWHGLFVADAFTGPLLVSMLVCVAWILAATAATWAILRHREFVPSAGSPRRRSLVAPLRIVTIAVAVVAVLAVATDLGPAGVTRARLQASLEPAFRRLTALQQTELGHPIPRGARYRIVPVCSRRAQKSVGPGDWGCTMNVYVLLPGTAQPLTDTPIAYDVSVESNGCYKATSPPLSVGQAVIHESRHRTVVNPIVTIYGCFDTL